MEQAKASSEDQSSQLTINEAQASHKQGGWITFPFIAGSVFGLGLAISGAMSNFIVYLIKEYNVKSIDAAQISNIVNGCTSVSPVIGAIIADAYFGCYPVFCLRHCYQLGVLFTVTAAVPSLRPMPCSLSSDSCKPASAGQLAVLYAAVALLAVGAGGTRFNSATVGANQFDKAQDQEVFFNWFFILLYAASIIGATAIVYIQDRVSWALGFACPPGSRQSVRKEETHHCGSTGDCDFYYGTSSDLVANAKKQVPTAVITRGDTTADGSVARPWRLCTVQQVEDLKTVVRILPLWTTSAFISVSIGVQGSLTILQALTVDRSLGRFTVPAGSMLVSSLAAVIVFLALLDRLLLPVWHRLTHHTPTPLQRIGAATCSTQPPWWPPLWSSGSARR
uniref:Protein NRT1/ PTR FAMILY 2.7-like n=1 Tax=Ananas comosus var. bracteatus TaxID=296719 RepID=A0A6V7PDD5_ANACO|nr:unnamed protein product [Ananas comosus var. bracteatus]